MPVTNHSVCKSNDDLKNDYLHWSFSILPLAHCTLSLTYIQYNFLSILEPSHHGLRVKAPEHWFLREPRSSPTLRLPQAGKTVKGGVRQGRVGQNMAGSRLGVVTWHGSPERCSGASGLLLMKLLVLIVSSMYVWLTSNAVYTKWIWYTIWYVKKIYRYPLP